MSEHIVNVTVENAQQYLIDESHNRPVMVDFWADWCAPCKNLMPVLEKLATEYNGQFLLAKVNADEQAMLTQQFGVQSLPTVMIMKDGQPIDGFAGAEPEQQIREILDKHLPKSWDIQLQEGRALVENGEASEALPLLQQAYTDSNQRADIALVLCAALIDCKRLDEAEAALGQIKMADQDKVYEHIKAELELAREAKKAPEIEALEAQVAENPKDTHLAYQLAIQYSAHEHNREALEILYSIVKKDLNAQEGEAKKIYRDILAVLGAGDPLAVEYQRKLYTLLY